MNYSVFTKPTIEPISISEARAHCRVTIPEDDGILAQYIIAARSHVEEIANLALMTQTIDATVDGGWPAVLLLPKGPAQSVTSISYVDDAGVTQVLASNQYRTAFARRVPEIWPAYGVTWPTVRDQADTITVRYVAGFGATMSDVPEPIRQALLLLIGHWYENRETVNVGSAVSNVPHAFDSLVAPFRVWY